MKKQRIISLLLVCLLAFGLAFALLSCTINLPGENNGGGTGGGSSTSNVVGTWVGYSQGYEFRLVFASNGSVSQYANGEYAGSGSWTVSSNTIRISMGGQTSSGTINGNTMYFDGITLTKR